MRQTTVVLFILIGFLLISCNNTAPDNMSDGTYLRISNVSQVEFESVYVSFPGVESTFKNIKSGAASDYRKVDRVYRYGLIEIYSGNGEFRLQPIDFVGEEPLHNGKFTYQLGIDSEGLTFNFVKE